MKVAIFGSYNGGSIGDTAILLGLISSIYRVLGDDVEITVLALGELGINGELKELGLDRRVKEVAVYKAFDDSLYGGGEFLNKIWRFFKRLRKQSPINKCRARKVLRATDVLLVGGGNLVMDLYKNWPKILRTVCDLSRDEKVPYYFVGVGSAPINTLQGENDLLYCLKSAAGVYFRDASSKKYCEERLGFGDSLVGPDLAFGIKCHDLTRVVKDNVLMLNVAAVYSERWPVEDLKKYSDYLSNMVRIVDRLVESLGIEKVVIFNTNYPLDEFSSEDFLHQYKSTSNFPVDISLLRGRNTVSRLLAVCSRARFSLVTRLHAGIVSYISGVRVFAVEYQPKVRDVLNAQTSNTIVESFDSVLSGTAFDSLDQSLREKISNRDYVSDNDVDALMSLVLKKRVARGG
ncbi:polysaccharide pyruvyl transferase family protein [Marinobacter sp. HN1S83]|uniref:polysaccharide pyruvyl transferase family protein n=1 Tax=Marinobacter sp. HN1S83 TaxID=3382301 RepID=UPI00387B0FD6